MKRLDEQEIIDGCIRGDKIYQEKLFKRFWGMCCSTTRRYVGIHDAKDVAQTAFLKIFNNLKKSESGSLEGYIKRVAITTAIDYLRTNKQLVFFSKLGDNDESVNNFLHFNSRENLTTELDFEVECFKLSKYKMDIEDLFKLIEEMSPRYRTVFNLYIFEGLSHKEIGEYLGININTSRVNLLRAKAQLVKKLNKRLTASRPTTV